MLTFVVILCGIGWIVPKVVVQKYPKWPVVILAVLLTWMATLAVGIGLMVLELGTAGADDAIRRMAGAWVSSLPFAAWSGVKFKLAAANGAAG